MKLCPKDLMQAQLTEGTVVEIAGQFLVFQNGSFTKSFRINDIFEGGNFWIDAVGKIVLVELTMEGQMACLLSINLKDEFDCLFPNAQENWGSYFFKLHYST
jgi:hypothetical protein